MDVGRARAAHPGHLGLGCYSKPSDDPPSTPRRAGLVSVVAPLYNEIETLQEFHRRLAAALVEEDYELVLLDDGSTDGTGGALDALAAQDPRVRQLHLSRNFGHQAALTAGYDAARGDAVVSIDADLQDPPEVIPVLLAAWRAGADVVHASRTVRPGEPRLRLWAIRLFYGCSHGLQPCLTSPGTPVISGC